MFQNVLNYIIAILILDQLISALMQLLQDRIGLLWSTVLQDPLDHATAIGMSWQAADLKWSPLHKSHFRMLISDSCVPVRWKSWWWTADERVPHTRYTFAPRGCHSDPWRTWARFLPTPKWWSLAVPREHSPKPSGSLDIRTFAMPRIEHWTGADSLEMTISIFHSERTKTVSYLLHQLGLLLRSSMLKKLLDNVIAKDIGHEVVSRGQDLVEHCLLLGWNCSLQLLLDESAIYRTIIVIHKL